MNISSIAKCVDQPIVLNKLQKRMPQLLVGVGTGYGILDSAIDTNKNKKFDSKKAVRNAIIISTTIAASLIGTRGLTIKGKKIFSGLMENTSLKELLSSQNKAIDEYLSKKQVSDNGVLNVLKKARKTHMNPREIDLLIKKLPEDSEKTKLFSVLLPPKENLSSKEIFQEMKRLSWLGAIPVIGGIVGGVIADKVTKTKSSVANKIKEGFYQYFANIALCNVGACGALFATEQLQKAKIIKPVTPLQKLFVILGGITATGIVGGSYIANKMCQKFVDPLFNKCQKQDKKGVYSERKPEIADICLHADDIATAGILSGFKWIEPALPIMYFVSGYRAGIGYRNNGHNKCGSC